jgi:biofilm PGA synthesis N-glycosyltransferase PgaC
MGLTIEPADRVSGLVVPEQPGGASEPDVVADTGEQGAISHRRSGRAYMPVRAKFLVAITVALCWVALSVWLSQPWLAELSEVLPRQAATLIITLVAYLPGGVVAFLAVSLVLDRQPGLRLASPDVPCTVIIAARNEAGSIAQTIHYVARQDYAGPVQLIVADNGSTDDTAGAAYRAAQAEGVSVRVVREERAGKSHALNTALAQVDTELMVTLDADTLLHPSALRQIVARLSSAPSDVVAVAGSMLARNSRAGYWARMQEWDYFLGIASVKRMQGLYQGTLVAQGAFSLYRTAAVRQVGGWPDAIGEDIVMTWHLLAASGRVYFEPTAVAFTDVPVTLRQLARQRARWARGMIEGLRAVPPWRQHSHLAKALTGVDLLVPLLDLGYTFLWIPGLLLALTGRFWIVGPWTVLVLPLTLLVSLLLYWFQRRKVFDRLALRVRRNWFGFVGYVVLYQMIMSPVAVYGYAQELVGARRRWK